MNRRTDTRRIHAVTLLTALTAVAIAACATEHDTPIGEPVALEGALKITMVANLALETAEHEYFVDVGDDNWIQLFLSTAGTAHHSHDEFDADSIIHVTGRMLGERKMEVDHIDVLATAQPGLLAASSTPTPKKVAVILANFQDNTSAPITADDARARVFTGTSSSHAYFKEISYGVRTLVGVNRTDGDVFGWYTLPINSASACDYQGWGSAARTAAQTAGVDLSKYDHVIHYFPRMSNCGWSGVGQVPGKYTWINGSSSQTISHELGHNFGVHHAASWSCTDANGARVAINADEAKCTLSEYGDPFDVMGRGYRHMNAAQKGRLGWFSSSNTVDATADGNFTVVPLETSSSAVQSLRIPRTFNTSGQPTSFLYVEYRQPIGFDNSSSVNGVLLHIAQPYTGSERVKQTKLLDLAPSSTSFSDAFLPVGGTFHDPVRNVKVRLDSKSATGAQINIDFQ